MQRKKTVRLSRQDATAADKPKKHSKAEQSSLLERYMRVLETIAIAPEPPSLSEIAHRCNLPVGTSHRILTTLVRTGLAQPSNSKRRDYQLGPRLLRLLHFGSDLAYVRIMLQPILDQLAGELGNTCFLARLSGFTTIRPIAWAVPPDGIGAYVVSGGEMPAHASATAKAIMAFQDDDTIKRALAGPIVKLTTKTITNRNRIREEYKAIRERGYATCWGEIEEGFGAIACPVHIPQMGVVYSVGTSGIASRLKRRGLQDTVAILKAYANELSRKLPIVTTESVRRGASNTAHRTDYGAEDLFDI
jgi:DNA-binding IclR family transcriptional regulator